MRVSVVRVGVSLTIPLEAYSNIKPAVELEAVLDPGDDPEEVHKVLYEQAKTLCMRQVLDLGEDMANIRSDLTGYLQNFFGVGKVS